MSWQEPHWDSQSTAADWSAYEATMAARAAARHIPLSGTFELTPFCNFQCKMCYIRLDREQAEQRGHMLAAGEWDELAAQAERAGTLYVLLTGGEPLSRPDFPEIYTAVTQRPFVVTLYTNAALVTPEHVRLFQKRPPTALTITLYGANPETYARITGDPNGFDKTMRGIELLRQVPTNLEIRTTFIRDNQHELEAIRKIANRYTNRFSINTRVFRPIRGAVADVDRCRLTPAEAFDIEEANRRYYRLLNKEMGVVPDAEPRAENRKKMGFDLEPKILNCLSAKAMYWVTWDGKMLPCGSFSSPYTDILEEGFEAAWQRLPGLLKTLRRADKCYTCALNEDGSCPNCPAETQAETGDFSQAADYICAWARERKQRVSHRQLPVDQE